MLYFKQHNSNIVFPLCEICIVNEDINSLCLLKNGSVLKIEVSWTTIALSFIWKSIILFFYSNILLSFISQFFIDKHKIKIWLKSDTKEENFVSFVFVQNSRLVNSWLHDMHYNCVSLEKTLFCIKRWTIRYILQTHVFLDW